MGKKIKKITDAKLDEKFPLPEYESEDDIYNQAKEIALENSTTVKDSSGVYLDIPGSELDDANEEIGEEDEENNYYSLGGDNHDNLEEDRQ